VVSLGIGVVGLAMPLVPGIPFVIAGVLLLGPDHRLVKPVTAWMKRRKFPGLRARDRGGDRRGRTRP
jgi:hypothetical protein